jgi:cell division protein FtsQ
MKRGLVFLLVTGVAVGVAALAARAPEALAGMEAFRVVDVQVRGTRFLAREAAVATLAVPATASVWDDLEVYRGRLLAHPLVREARVRRRLPGTLVAEVRERDPVAMVPSPDLAPVDGEGRTLPIDPIKFRLDLPILVPAAGEEAPTLTPAQRRTLAREIARLAQADPELVARLSDLSLDRRGDLRAQVLEPAGVLLLRPGLPVRRIQEGLRVLADAAGRFEGMAVTNLDLRYEDQVVVRLQEIKGS